MTPHLPRSVTLHNIITWLQCFTCIPGDDSDDGDGQLANAGHQDQTQVLSVK